MKNSTSNMQKLRNVFNRDDPNMPVIIILLAIAALLSVILAIGLGPVSVAPGNVAKIVGSTEP